MMQNTRLETVSVRKIALSPIFGTIFGATLYLTSGTLQAAEPPPKSGLAAVLADAPDAH